MPWIMPWYGGKKMTELCVLGVAISAGAVTLCVSLARLWTDLASGRRLQQLQPLARNSLRIPVALPLIFDFQPRPLVGIERLEVRPAEYAIGRGLGREQCRIRPAGGRFLHSGVSRRDASLRVLGGGRRRAGGKRREQA